VSVSSFIGHDEVVLQKELHVGLRTLACLHPVRGYVVVTVLQESLPLFRY
jgi:hypothetical protein